MTRSRGTKLATMMRMSTSHRVMLGSALAILGALPLGGCGTDDEDYSEHYAISALNASYGAFAEDGRLKVYAALLGDKGFVRLRGGDTFEIDVDGTRVPSTERLLDGKVHYIADVPEPAGETEVAITFVRGVERVRTSMKLYSLFTVPSPPTVLQAGGKVDIDIDPRPDLSKWPGFFGPSLVGRAEVLGDCVGSQQFALCSKDSTADKCTQAYPLVLDAAKLVASSSSSCPITVKIRLTSAASAFEGEGPQKQTFKGGGFDGHRGVSLPMQLTPR